jgi:hypothetical protein
MAPVFALYTSGLSWKKYPIHLVCPRGVVPMNLNLRLVLYEIEKKIYSRILFGNTRLNIVA